jgi:hypothetical protein
MVEKTTNQEQSSRSAHEEIREHARAARTEFRASLKSVLPPQFFRHGRKARKEMLLAWRSLIDAALEHLEEKEEAS